MTLDKRRQRRRLLQHAVPIEVLQPEEVSEEHLDALVAAKAFRALGPRCLALPGPAWPCLALPRPAWPCLALPGLAWPCLASHCDASCACIMRMHHASCTLTCPCACACACACACSCTCACVMEARLSPSLRSTSHRCRNGGASGASGPAPRMPSYGTAPPLLV